MDPKELGDLAEVWEGRTLKQELSDILQVSPEPNSPQLIDSESLDKALDFGYGILHAWKQRVFSIRTVFLLDACIIGFKFLQPLCDANGSGRPRKHPCSSTDHVILGAYQIIQAYCSLLRGERITHTIPGRPPLSLKPEVLETCIEKIECYQIADLHKSSMRRTWGSRNEGSREANRARYLLPVCETCRQDLVHSPKTNPELAG